MIVFTIKINNKNNCLIRILITNINITMSLCLAGKKFTEWVNKMFLGVQDTLIFDLKINELKNFEASENIFGIGWILCNSIIVIS